MTPQLIEERLAVLDGRRPRAIEGAAVTIADLAAVMQLSNKLQSAQAVGATPTAAEFNALQRDVAEIHRRLVALTVTIQARIIDAGG